MPESNAKILIVTDDVLSAEVLRSRLRLDGYRVKSARSGDSGLEILAAGGIDMVLADLSDAAICTADFPAAVQAVAAGVPVGVLVPYAAVPLGSEAVRKGAFGFTCKPFKGEELLLLVRRALEFSQALSENEELRDRLDHAGGPGGMVGASEAMEQVYALIRKVARSDSSVLIRGESGTGKELVAKAIHELSRRQSKPFVPVNFAALPPTLLESELFGYVKGAFTGANRNRKGLFESAHGGVVLLDEIGSAPPAMQMRLLRVLQEREVRPVGANHTIPVDVRVLAATNEDLENRMQEGQFREDLYYRLSVVTIQLPPLRDRREDIPLLVRHFLEEFAKNDGVQLRIERDALNAMMDHDWPGNVRELQNAIRRGCTLCDGGVLRRTDMQHLKKAAGPAGTSGAATLADNEEIVTLKSFVKRREREYVRYVVDRLDGDKDQAAKRLGISLATLYRKFDG